MKKKEYTISEFSAKSGISRGRLYYLILKGSEACKEKGFTFERFGKGYKIIA